MLVGGLATSYVITLLLALAFPRTLVGLQEKALWSLLATFGDLAGYDDSGFNGHLGHAWIFTLAGLMSAAALLWAFAVLWRAQRHSSHLSADEDLELRALLLRDGEDDSLGYFATRRDRAVVFSPDRRAAVVYRTQGSVSVASGDPIGDRESWPGAVAAWIADARTRGRYPAVLSASAAGSTEYVAHGLRALALGDEAILDADSFSLSGRDMKPIRQAVTRVRRAGYTAQVRRCADLAPQEVDEVVRLADAWRGNDTERGFSMALGRLGDPADGRCLIVTAVAPDGSIRGLLTFVPWGRRGASLDVMRRSPDAENGVTEFMVAALMDAAEGLGLRRVSLNSPSSGACSARPTRSAPARSPASSTGPSGSRPGTTSSTASTRRTRSTTRTGRPGCSATTRG